MVFIDLSLPLNNDTPVYPGDPKVKIEPVLTIEKDACSVHSISIATHVGTHIDSPSHMINGGKSLAQFPLEKFTGNGVCIDVTSGFDLEKITSFEIKDQDIVLFYTGWDLHVQNEDYYINHPTIPQDVAEYLVSKHIKMVGIDFPSPDHDPYPIHKILLGSDILILESLINLKELVGKNFTLYAFPLNLDLDGSPVRVAAEVL